MGAIYHDPYTSASKFIPEEMNDPLSALDRALGYLKNCIVGCDGTIYYDLATGTLTWDAPLRILFVRSDGVLTRNTVNTGSIVLLDDYAAYIDLSETNDTTVAVSRVSLDAGSVAETKAVNRIVLGYRNGASGRFYPLAIRLSISASSVSFATLEDGPGVFAGQGGKVVSVKVDESGLEYTAAGDSVSALTDLSDVPASYADQGGKMLVVRSDETAIEFVAVPESVASFAELTDGPGAFDDQAGKGIRVNDDENALEYFDLLTSFLALTDTPDTFTGQGGKIVSVKSDESGLEFIAKTDAGLSTFLALSDTPDEFTNQALKPVRVNAGATGLEFYTPAAAAGGDWIDALIGSLL